VDNLIADARKAKEKLGWEPKVGFDGLVRKMVKYDLERYGLHEQAEKIK
jgi:GDPmannose 4,6-dehydratase